MGAVREGRFECDSCGKSYAWKPQLAGRRARCACGHEIVVPRHDEHGDEFGDYELAAPSRGGEGAAKVVPAQSVSAQPIAAQPVRATKVVGYRRPGAARSDGKPDYVIDPVKDHYAPLWLIVGGVVVTLGFNLLFRWRGDTPILTVFRSFGINMVLHTAFLLVAVMIAAKLRGISLGPFPIALMKLCAISVAPRAIGILVAPLFIFVPLGGLIVAIGEFAIWFALLGALFDLDESDTWFITAVAFLMGVAFVIGMILWR